MKVDIKIVLWICSLFSGSLFVAAYCVRNSPSLPVFSAIIGLTISYSIGGMFLAYKILSMRAGTSRR